MAKKNKGTVHNASVLFADEAKITESLDNSLNNESGSQQTVSRKSFRASLSGGRLGVIAAILFVTLGAMGAGLKYLEESAKRQANQPASDRKNNGSYLSSFNPFMPDPIPSPSASPTPQLSKEYIYAGSRLLAVEDKNANAAPPADLAVWRVVNGAGTWYVMGGQGSQAVSIQWGGSTNNVNDLTVPGDYDGDGKTDFSVFRPSNGIWYIQRSSDSGTNAYAFGQSGDKTAQADYDGDGKTDAAVFRNGTWYVQRSSDSGLTAQAFGLSTDTPVPADFDGDGRADIAVWRNTDARFYVLRSGSNSLQTIIFGHTDDTPVVADFDGDGKADAAVWRPSTAPNNEGYQWQILYSSDQSYHAASMGNPASDKAVQNDYDGDGKVDVAIWRPSEGKWYIQKSTGGNRIELWGQAGDTPVPAFYRR